MKATHPCTPPNSRLANSGCSSNGAAKKGHNNIRKNTGRERAWKVMRLMPSYIMADVATLAEVDIENLRHWHQCLVAAGYAAQVGTKKQEARGGCDKVFRLVKNTGPKCPIQKDLRFLFDQNTGAYWGENPHEIARLMENVEPPTINGPLPPVTGKIKLGSGVKLLSPRGKRGAYVD